MDRIDPRDAILVVIDAQERLFPRVWRWERVLERLLFTIRGSNIFNIPIMVTEQNPKGLGPTLREVERALPTYAPDMKMAFSAFDCAPFCERVTGSGRRTLVVTGIETHICVLQTVMDAISLGFKVHVVADAVSSTDAEDHATALARMTAMGAVVTTSQSLLYEIMRSADREDFRDLLELIRSGRKSIPALYSFEEGGQDHR
ncbi:MAG: hydrolase [Thermoplasmata archaeon]|nr:hydrolase [Thermoplasmata archaeon]